MTFMFITHFSRGSNRVVWAFFVRAKFSCDFIGSNKNLLSDIIGAFCSRLLRSFRACVDDTSLWELKHLLREATERAQKLLIFIKCSSTQEKKCGREPIARTSHHTQKSLKMPSSYRKFKRIFIREAYMPLSVSIISEVHLLLSCHILWWKMHE